MTPKENEMKTSMAFMDKLPAPIRHNIYMLLGYFFTVLTSIQAGEPFVLKVFLSGVVGVEIAVALLYLAPFNSQYGIGKTDTTPKI